MTQKIFLKVEPSGSGNSKIPYILEVVKDKGDITVNNGKIVKLATVDHGYRVYIWKFTNLTGCSSAKSDHFVSVLETEKFIEGDPETGGRLTYPFFTLKQGKMPRDGDTCSASSEQNRINALMVSLQKSGHYVQVVYSIQAYCPFSGGGDIYIQNDLKESSLVITSEEAQG